MSTVLGDPLDFLSGNGDSELCLLGMSGGSNGVNDGGDGDSRPVGAVKAAHI
jgi:hypothetical protein